MSVLLILFILVEPFRACCQLDLLMSLASLSPGRSRLHLCISHMIVTQANKVNVTGNHVEMSITKSILNSSIVDFFLISV